MVPSQADCLSVDGKALAEVWGGCGVSCEIFCWLWRRERVRLASAQQAVMAELGCGWKRLCRLYLRRGVLNGRWAEQGSGEDLLGSLADVQNVE